MEVGTALFPNIAPLLITMLMYYLFKWYRILGEVEAAGVEPHWALSSVLSISSEPK
jgi:hypothetical protein